MLRLFEKNTGLQAVLVTLALVLLWLPSLLAPPPMEPSTGEAPLYGLLFGLSLPPLAAVIVAMLLVLVGGLLLNLKLATNGLVSQNTLLPTLMYIVAMSATESTLSPTLLTGVASVGVIGILLVHGTPMTLTTNKICNSRALIGITSMFYLPALALLLTYLLVTINYRLYRWRDYAAMLLGLLAPYIALWCTLFMHGTLDSYWLAVADSLSGIGLVLAPTDTLGTLANAVIVLFMAVSIFSVWAKMGKNTLLWQKNATSLMLLTMTGVLLLFYTQLFPLRLSLFAIPFAFCGALRFIMGAKRSKSRSSSRKFHIPVFDLLFIIILIAAFLC